MKLVAVGMRYQKNIDGILSDLKKPSCVKEVFLRVEDNDSGVDGKAVAVFYGATKIAYIRNSDVPYALKWINGPAIEGTYVSKVSANYLIIESYSLGLNKNIFKYDNVVANTTTQYISTDTAKDKKADKMNLSNSMRDSFFREVKNVAIDIQSGKFGVVSADGISVYTNGGVSVNPITDFGVKIPAFAMRVGVDNLAEGDIILNGNDASFFRAKTDNGYEVVTLSGEVKQVGNVTNLFFGKNTVLAVKNMFGEGGSTNPMLMAMMLGGEGKDGFDMKTFALMSMMGGGQMDQNMMLMAMMMNK